MQITGSRGREGGVVVEPVGRVPWVNGQAVRRRRRRRVYPCSVPSSGPFLLCSFFSLSHRRCGRFSRSFGVSITLSSSLFLSRSSFCQWSSTLRSPQRSRFPRFELLSSHRRRCRCRRPLPSSSSCYFSSSARASRDRYGPIYFRSRQRRRLESRLRT